jgi:hypothetical protein
MAPAGDVEPGELLNGFFHADMRRRTALGLDAVDGRLRIEPHLSEGWGNVQLDHIAVGAKEAATLRR